MTEWDMTAIEKMEKVIPLDSYMSCGKEEYNHCGKHMDGYFEMGYLEREQRACARWCYAPVKFGIVSGAGCGYVKFLCVPHRKRAVARSFIR